MESRNIRRSFLEFFEARGHRRVPSSSLVPNDPSLLLTAAGMVQFKPYMLGLVEPPYPRAVSVQKSFRTTDIELVGLTARHQTLFEMLGNFSFGDYFKSEACAWSYELVTGDWGIDPGRLWVTVFETDDEAAEIWADQVGVPRDRIVRRGKADNFWDMGVAGPCGPCSEIYVDRGPKYGPDGGPAVDEERFIEIWNLVFMQNLCDDDINVIGDLPKKNIDTGSGLERVAIVLQEVPSAYETDLFVPLMEVTESLAGRRHGEDERSDISLKILAEHGRATSFLVADGVLPSNEGRGYVLRRMLRRMVIHARRLGIQRSVTPRLVETTVELMGDVYPELVENRAFILEVAGSEEDRFGATLRQGLALLEREIGPARPTGQLLGDVAFRLHDTHGFPLELTLELARDEGLEVDVERFGELMEEQRRRSLGAGRDAGAGEAVVRAVTRVGRTEFLGYERLEADAAVLALVADGAEVEVAGEGQEVRVLLSRTPFYAEAGGQVGDEGLIRAPGGLIRVEDTKSAPGGAIVHLGRVESGEVRQGEVVQAEVDRDRREATARSHTATHVVHWTLRHLLGEHARQAGSLVEPGRLRFDFTHHSALPGETLEEAEHIVNVHLADDTPVRAFETTLDEARQLGAIALFEETYGDLVRVVEVGEYSRELCGGTHVPHTGRVAFVRVLGEGGIGSGLRRLQAVVGPDALHQVNLERRLLEEVAEVLSAGDPATAPERARHLVEELKRLQNELGMIRKATRDQMVAALADQASRVDGVALVISEVPGEGADGLRELALALREKLERDGAGAVVLGNADGARALLVASCTAPLVERGITAPLLLDRAAKAIGGGAGGKPILGFAGGPNAAALGEALESIPSRLRELASGT
jgi:alanyl-tRNA synthetase